MGLILGGFRAGWGGNYLHFGNKGGQCLFEVFVAVVLHHGALGMLG